ncbi:cell division control protein 15, CDC15, putative [Entamoeba invadens IP1]|uniref:non-specific serine/threonine protein kinase n=1 Tax=Entamoeba invadens IP1 TaxID=370355 RepID=A0A0A1UG63_ENTIV|nr:cell division control protein 15, CDC15, putative [Entamoeba invadens IP1]ELP94457.1 cell division control protein 15, CDC15, putative [Entamoeba invadens IP1]|eukprot:XP_004261228.1 cell division control protein 15, CDC15, putative [Entamoeba invadens IP1]
MSNTSTNEHKGPPHGSSRVAAMIKAREKEANERKGFSKPLKTTPPNPSTSNTTPVSNPKVNPQTTTFKNVKQSPHNTSNTSPQPFLQTQKRLALPKNTEIPLEVKETSHKKEITPRQIEIISATPQKDDKVGSPKQKSQLNQLAQSTPITTKKVPSQKIDVKMTASTTQQQTTDSTDTSKKEQVDIQHPEKDILNDQIFNSAHYTPDDDYDNEIKEKPRKTLNAKKVTKKSKKSKKKPQKVEKVEKEEKDEKNETVAPQQQEKPIENLELNTTEIPQDATLGQPDILNDLDFNTAISGTTDDDYEKSAPKKRKALNAKKPKSKNAKKKMRSTKIDESDSLTTSTEMSDTANTNDEVIKVEKSPRNLKGDEKMVQSSPNQKLQSDTPIERKNSTGSLHMPSPSAPPINPFNIKEHISEDKLQNEDPMVTKILRVEVDKKELVYNIANSIGRGAFGEVLKGMNADSGEFVAIKQMKVNKKSVLKEVEEEIKLLRFLKNDYIVRYIASTQSFGCLYIVMEYMESGSLLNIVKQFKQLNEVLTAKYIYQVLIGLEYIHSQGIVHRDIKAANILVAKDGRVKIADFGVSIQTSDLENGNSEDPIGTPNWMSPEVIQMQGTTVKADIWALGCTILELITGNPPYWDLNPTAALYRICTDDHPPFPLNASPLLKVLLLDCFKTDINIRASSKELLSNEWFSANGVKLIDTTPKVSRPLTLSKPPTLPKPKGSVAIDSVKTGDIDDWGDEYELELNAKEPANTPKKQLTTKTVVATTAEDLDWGDDFGPNTPTSLSGTLKDKSATKQSVTPLTKKTTAVEIDDDWGDIEFPEPKGGQSPIKSNESVKKTDSADDIFEKMNEDDSGDGMMKIAALDAEVSVSEKKQKFLSLIKDMSRVIDLMPKDYSARVEKIIMELTKVCYEKEFTEMDSILHMVGIMPVFAVLEREEFSNVVDLRYNALKIINTVISKSGRGRMNIMLSGGMTIINFGLSQAKMSDKVLSELTKFVSVILADNTNKYQLAQMFINCGGLTILSQILAMKYDTFSFNIETILDVLIKFVKAQTEDITNRIEICSRNIIVLLFLKYKIIDTLIQFVCKTVALKEFNAALKAITLLNQIVDSVVKNDNTWIKPEISHRIILNDLLLIKIDEKTVDANYVQEEVLFNISRLCKNMLSESDEEIREHLLGAKIITFLLRVLDRCNRLDPEMKERDKTKTSKPILKKMMKKGVINNVIQCLNCIILNALPLEKKFFSEFLTFPNVFNLLKSYCETAKNESSVMSEVTVDIMLKIASALTKSNKSSDFIINNGITFFIDHIAVIGLRAHFFSAIQALYLANTKRGLAELSVDISVLRMAKILKAAKYEDNVSLNELGDFYRMISDQKLIAAKLADSVFLNAFSYAVQSIPTDLIEAKKKGEECLKLLLIAHPDLASCPFHNKIITNLESIRDDGLKDGKIVISRMAEECMDILNKASNDSNTKKMPSISKRIKDDHNAHKRGESWIASFGTRKDKDETNSEEKSEKSEKSEDSKKSEKSEKSEDYKEPKTPKRTSGSNMKNSTVPLDSPRDQKSPDHPQIKKRGFLTFVKK